MAKNLEDLLRFYNHSLSTCRHQLVGQCTLQVAFDEVNEGERGAVRLLRESRLIGKDIYPNVTRQNGRGCCCDYIVHDGELEEVYFYSRMVGAGSGCTTPTRARVVVELRTNRDSTYYYVTGTTVGVWNARDSYYY